MNQANPFEAPTKSALSSPDSEAFSDMDFAALKKLRNHSQTILVLGVLWALGAAVNIGVGVFALIAGREGSSFGVVNIVIACFAGFAAYGAFTRPSWGRVVGIVLCTIALIGFPLGTAIGILGLIALIGGDKLFGPGRYLHRDVERAYKARKSAKV